MVAMVAGTVAPDLPMFVPTIGRYSVSHSLTGVFSVDLLWSVVMVALWYGLVRDALVDTAPAVVRERLSPAAAIHGRQMILLPVAAVVGSLTHVCWDAFTHDGRWGMRHIGWLRNDHIGWAGYHWAQAVSSVVGLVGLAVWSLTELRRQPRRPHAPVLTAFGRVPWLIAGTVTMVASLAMATRLSQGLHAAAIHGAEVGLAALGVGLLVMSSAWQWAVRFGDGADTY